MAKSQKRYLVLLGFGLLVIIAAGVWMVFGRKTQIYEKTEEIFGNKEVEKYYKNKIQELIDIGYTYEDIIELLESKDIPLNLNITIYIKNLIETPNEKN